MDYKTDYYKTSHYFFHSIYLPSKYFSLYPVFPTYNNTDLGYPVILRN